MVGTCSFILLQSTRDKSSTEEEKVKEMGSFKRYCTCTYKPRFFFFFFFFFLLFACPGQKGVTNRMCVT